MSRAFRAWHSLFMTGVMAFTGYEAWRMSAVVFAGESALFWLSVTVTAAVAPVVIAHMSGQQWNGGGGIRLAPVIIALGLVAFAWGVERRLAAEGLDHSWWAAVGIVYVAALAPVFVWVCARTAASQQPEAVVR